MKQVLNDIEKIKNKLSEDERQEIINIEEKISDLVGKELEIIKLKEILIDVERGLFKFEEKLEKEYSKKLAEEVYLIRRKVMKTLLGIDYIHGI